MITEKYFTMIKYFMFRRNVSTDFLGTKAVSFENKLLDLNSSTSVLSLSAPW